MERKRKRKRTCVHCGARLVRRELSEQKFGPDPFRPHLVTRDPRPNPGLMSHVSNQPVERQRGHLVARRWGLCGPICGVSPSGQSTTRVLGEKIHASALLTWSTWSLATLKRCPPILHPPNDTIQIGEISPMVKRGLICPRKSHNWGLLPWFCLPGDQTST